MVSSKKTVSTAGVFCVILSIVSCFSPWAVAKESGKVETRTKKQVENLIASEGRKAPDWWKDVKPDYPQTLNLDFPDSAPNSGWDNQRNVGQFVWDIVNPNPHRWRSGIKLFHLLLQRHKDDVKKRTHIMRELGLMYFRFEQDYARAAFWWEKSGDVQRFPGMSAFLVECYWRLGNKQMALDVLKTQQISLPQIKLLGDMGETDRALKLCESLAKSNPLIVNFYAGDVCRIAGRNKEALSFYQKSASAPRGHERNEPFRSRAIANIAGLKAFELLDLKRIPDGTYKSNSIGYEGPIHVEVTVKSGRIEDVRVTDHREKQFYSSITDTIRQVKEKQGVKGIDAASGATMTSEAIINATAKALAEAMNK